MQESKTVPPLPDDDSGYDDGADPDQLYCFCRQPDMQTFMIMYECIHVLSSSGFCFFSRTVAHIVVMRLC